MSQTLSGLFLVGAANRPRRKKSQKKIGKISEKGGKVPKSTKRINKDGGVQKWATPKPSHNKPSHPHVPSWAIFLSEGFRGSVQAVPSQEPATLVLKCRMGVQGSTQEPPLGGQIPPKLTSDGPALI